MKDFFDRAARKAFSCALIISAVTISQAQSSEHASTGATGASSSNAMKNSTQSQDASKQATSASPSPQANPADVASLDAIMAAVYDVISGPPGKKRDWDRMRSLFIPGARIIPVGRAQSGEITPRVLTVEDYISRSGPLLEGEGFIEKEIARRVEQFGHIAHVFSTYEGRIGGHPQSKTESLREKAQVIRGINSFQLMNDGKRWWVVTIFWEAENKDNPIPEKYLKK
ncbi:MAG TPA: hypothetical protein VNN73_14100 [Blastocatellia bacterium]|nr:hypothetical protein [Blastocatellia bacterium]